MSKQSVTIFTASKPLTPEFVEVPMRGGGSVYVLAIKNDCHYTEAFGAVNTIQVPVGANFSNTHPL